MATTHCLYACRHDPDDLLKFKLNFRIGKKEDLSDFKWGVVFFFWFLVFIWIVGSEFVAPYMNI